MAEQIGHMRGPVDAVHDFSCKQAFLRREGIDGRDRTRNTQRHAPGADMTLYGYWRSTTSYRVRIALALKGIACKQLSVNLVTGEQVAEGYARLQRVTELALAQLNVQRDPARAVGPTAASTAPQQAREELFPVHGYADETLMKDMRFKIGHALRNAGLNGTEYARQVCGRSGRARIRRPLWVARTRSA